MTNDSSNIKVHTIRDFWGSKPQPLATIVTSGYRVGVAVYNFYNETTTFSRKVGKKLATRRMLSGNVVLPKPYDGKPPAFNMIDMLIHHGNTEDTLWNVIHSYAADTIAKEYEKDLAEEYGVPYNENFRQDLEAEWLLMKAIDLHKTIETSVTSFDDEHDGWPGYDAEVEAVDWSDMRLTRVEHDDGITLTTWAPTEG